MQKIEKEEEEDEEAAAAADDDDDDDDDDHGRSEECRVSSSPGTLSFLS